ncbi:MAG: V-type ATPase subunit [Trueperaceae bacterium]|nr:V-type ATPase subunit [Trueperaceae bacterium]
MLAAVGYASAQARTRARRARLLEGGTWRELLNASGRERALDILAETAHPHVAQTEHVERTLRRHVYRDTRSLADALPRRGRELLRWYASRFEVQDLKLLIRALHHRRSIDEALAGTTRQADDDPIVAELAAVRSLDALRGVMAGRPYGKALDDAWDRFRAERRPFFLEVALDLAFQQGLVSRIEALGRGDRQDAETLLGRWLARGNLLAAARYRNVAGMRPEEVVNFCLHKDFGGGLAMVQRVAAGAPLQVEAAALGVELPPDASERENVRALEKRTEALRRLEAHRRFARSPFGIGLPLAYLIELEAEVDDLVRLLEAKRQGRDVDLPERPGA